MDVNGTRFQLLLGYDDWADCSDDGTRQLRTSWVLPTAEQRAVGVIWDKERMALTMRKHLFHFAAPPGGQDLTWDRRRGAGRDRYGNWYWIDGTRGQILVRSAGDGSTARFWGPGDGVAPADIGRFGDFQPVQSAPPPAPALLSGLAVTADHYLSVGTFEPAGLLVFDLHTPGPPRQILWPVPFTPFDMAPAPGGGLWILDRDPSGASGGSRYWALDRAFNVIWQDSAASNLPETWGDGFVPAGGAAAIAAATSLPTPAGRSFPKGFSLDASSPIAARYPVAIEGLPDGTVLILDSAPQEPFSSIYRYRFGQQLGAPASTEAVLDVIEDDTFRLSGYDFAFMPEQRDSTGAVLTADRIYLVPATGAQAFAFEISAPNEVLTLTALPVYLPMRQFGGKGLVTGSDTPYYDFGNGWIPLIEGPRAQYDAHATVYTPIHADRTGESQEGRGAFDGREPDCIWHRLFIDACIPPETSITVYSRAANDEVDLRATSWQPEPGPRLRAAGSEQPYVTGMGSDSDATWELLFQSARGRYLQLKLVLASNGRSTPVLRAVRAYYPRFSYLNHYLPGAYRADSQSASFLDRFLANFEGFYTDIEDKIANVQILFDPRSAPPDVLPWLAGWFGLALDSAWDERRRRLLIKHAMTFFQYRGTIRGIMMALRLALDSYPDESIFSDRPNASAIRIVEKYLTRRAPGVVFGDPTDATGLQLVPLSQRWQPSEGGLALKRRYGSFLHAAFPDRYPADLPIEYPLSAPPDQLHASAWEQFSQSVLGFIPSTEVAQAAPFRQFLARRYGYLGPLNDRLDAGGFDRITGFSEIQVPQTLPPDGDLLRDWYQFQTVVLPMRRNAHRFTVLIPAASDATPDEHRQRLELAQRITDLEKPAHTIFDVKSYWAAFVVGQVRLGTDTVVDLGGRSPHFMSAMVLGQGYLVEAYLAAGHPQNVPDRQILGRDRLGQ